MCTLLCRLSLLSKVLPFNPRPTCCLPVETMANLTLAPPWPRGGALPAPAIHRVGVGHLEAWLGSSVRSQEPCSTVGGRGAWDSPGSWLPFHGQAQAGDHPSGTSSHNWQVLGFLFLLFAFISFELFLMHTPSLCQEQPSLVSKPSAHCIHFSCPGSF